MRHDSEGDCPLLFACMSPTLCDQDDGRASDENNYQDSASLPGRKRIGNRNENLPHNGVAMIVYSCESNAEDARQGVSVRCNKSRSCIAVPEVPAGMDDESGSADRFRCQSERLTYLDCRRRSLDLSHQRSEERRVGKECRSRWSPY